MQQLLVCAEALNATFSQMFMAWLVQALHAASFRMHLPRPRFFATMLNEIEEADTEDDA
jgi:hypothetical protein